MSSCWLLFTLLARTVLLGDPCHTINATVTPAPFAAAQEGDNVTLSCVVSQRRPNAALPVVRWTFLPAAAAERPEDEVLVARVNMKKARFYGNYTKSFQRPKLKLSVVKQGRTFDLLVLNVSREDRGRYACRVQEFRKHGARWRAFSNSTAATELTVHVLPAAPEDKDRRLWSLFEDVYLCAVLLCSLGLLCVCVFCVVLGCQRSHRKHRFKDNHLLVYSPQYSSGETVTSVVSGSPALPKKQRRYRKKRSHARQEDTPPEIPAKAPIADKVRRPKLLKPLQRKVVLHKMAEDSLTYAELELVKPPLEDKTSCRPTLYAQILFPRAPAEAHPDGPDTAPPRPPLRGTHAPTGACISGMNVG